MSRSTPLLSVVTRLLPTSVATWITITLSNQSIRPPLKPEERAALDEGRQIKLDSLRGTAAWEWGTGPLVLLVHGLGGHSGQMATLGKAVAAAGFRAVAFDVGGHGRSPGRSTSWSSFGRHLEHATKALQQPVWAAIGHSAGALCMMAARGPLQWAAERYVCIAAPSFPYPPVEAVRNRVAPPPAVLARYREYLAAQLSCDWQELEAGHAFQGADGRLLIIHDRSDRYVDHTQADRISRVCKCEVIKLEGFGHTRVLGAPETHTAVLDFLRKTGEPDRART